jgi:hypothetical protein
MTAILVLVAVMVGAFVPVLLQLRSTLRTLEQTLASSGQRMTRDDRPLDAARPGRARRDLCSLSPVRTITRPLCTRAR